MLLNFGMFCEVNSKMSAMIRILQLFVLGTLLQGSDDIEGQNRQHGAVHGHGDGHFVQRDLVEQDLHVLDGADAHASLTHVAHDAFVVGVVATVCGQVEGH